MSIFKKKNIKPVEGKNNKPESVKRKTKFGKLPKYSRVLIIVFAVLIFILGAGAGTFFIYINSINKTINSGTSSEIQSILTPISSSEAPVTVLILGRDTRDTQTDPGRADTIMVLHLNPGEKRIALLSIPRDTLVDIPGHGKDKINAAYAYGDEELMIKTVSNFLGANINHYVTLDFDGFIKLIDQLGGVDIVVDRPLIDPKTGANFSAGKHHLTGEQALAFTRSRSTELGDIGRIQRQQYVVRELISQKLDVKYLSKIPDYFNILVNNTRTDLDLLTILSYAKSALSFSGENISSAIIPSHPDWINNGTVSVQIPDEEEAKAMWQRIIIGNPISQYGAEYSEVDAIPDSMGENTYYKIKVQVKNTGGMDWNGTGDNPFYLSYHWLEFDSKKTVVFDGERTLLPNSIIKSGDESTFEMKILSPSKPGNYILQIDMVNEGKTWFSYQGVAPLEKYVAVNILYSAQYDDNNTTPNEVTPGQQFTTEVNITNTGFLSWNHLSDNRVDLGVHWLNRDTGQVEIWESDSGELPVDLDHNQSATVKMIITAPDKPGRYILQYDLAQEKITWFSGKGVIPLDVDINVGRTLDKSIAKQTSVIVFNGSGINGAGSQFANYLKFYGFKIFKIANAKEYNFSKTTLVYKKENLEKAVQLALILGNYDMVQYSDQWTNYDSPADVILIIGKDYKQNMK